MLFIEKDAKAEEIFIHADPAELRGFAKRLWAISEKAEAKGKHKEQLTSKLDSEIELSTKPHVDPRKHSAIEKLTISCSV